MASPIYKSLRQMLEKFLANGSGRLGVEEGLRSWSIRGYVFPFWALSDRS